MRQITLLDIAKKAGVAGISVSKNGNHFNQVLKRNIPVVFFDRVCDDVDVSKVVIDDEKSAFDAFMFLINKGYKNIAHFAGPKSLDICKKRLKGYRSALQFVGMKLNKRLISFGGLHEEDGNNAIASLIKNKFLPDAIYAANDPVAIGAYQKMKEVGLRIPKDIVIVGFSNNKITSLVEPQMTTVNQPSFEMGKKIAKY